MRTTLQPHPPRQPHPQGRGEKADPNPSAQAAQTAATRWNEKNPWFVVSLCDGIGGAFLALHLADLPFHGIAAEKEPHLRDFTFKKWPHLEMHKTCDTIKTDKIIKQATSSNSAGVWLVGGPPCQPFSCAGQRGGFQDGRSNPLVAFCELKRELQVACEEASLDFNYTMEEVATMSVDHRKDISELIGDDPTLIEAGDFGWVQRSRLYWGLSSRLQPGVRAGLDWEYFPPGTHFEDLGVLRWTGKRFPCSWRPDSGDSRSATTNQVCQSPPVPGGSWRATYDGRRYNTLTTCYPHKPDHGNKSADVTQLKRFYDDGGRFPLNAYAADQCIQVGKKDGSTLRVLSAGERERLMGYPPRLDIHSSRQRHGGGGGAQVGEEGGG